MLTITLDPHAPTPIYLQLYSAIKDRIIRKELAPDTILPSKRALALHLGVSIKTSTDA